ncbi:MAG TPA: chemotaxis protein CheA [Opitutaceae bacterium]|nr:chemotaxis protein CheA [Opitutaceae bacterium]
MNLPDPTQTFLLEASDLLDQIEQVALELDGRPDDIEAINRMFRAFHTLKGSGAMFGFDAVASFTHHVETALDNVRNGKLAVTSALLQTILASRDQIQILLHDPQSAAAAAECAKIVAGLRDLTGAAEAADPVAVSKKRIETEKRATWKITFQPPAAIASSGMNPISLLDELRSLGECEVSAKIDGVPALSRLQPEECYFNWEVRLTTDRGLNAIKDVFIFVEDDSKLTYESVSPAPAPTAPAVSGSATPAAATPKEKEPEAALVAPSASRAETPSATSSAKKTAQEATVRVPSSKLDRLVNLVGELVMNQSRLAQVSAGIANTDLAAPVEAIERLIDELRESVLGIRMMPIGSTFSRFKRLVHDLSHELEKEIDLVTEGAETEVDKTVLDQLGDPLVHLIRNCIDHAICPPDERVRLGKPRRGTIRLKAQHAGSHVIISIQDDGRGLNSDAIRAKGIEKGLIAPDAELSEKDIFNLIFLPGFSTAKTITTVSGRGVGMDVVKRQLDALRGTIHLASQRGKGTTITLTLPLTLAIIDGLLVELAGDQYILPMSAVTENVEIHRAERSRQNGRNVFAVRGELLPYIRLREVFALSGDGPDIEKIVIVRHEDQRVGLVVDRVLGSHQTVIQPLGRFYRNIEVCSGSTIMGDGRVALIFDLPGLIRHAERGAPLTRPRAA